MLIDAKGSFKNASLSGGNLFFADNHVGDGLRLICRFDRLVGVPLITLFYVSGGNLQKDAVQIMRPRVWLWITLQPDLSLA